MPAAQRAIAVFGSSSIRPGSADWEDAARCGRLLARAGLAVVTGGYGGAMEAVSQGAAACGGHVVGIIAPSVFPSRPGANPHVTEIVEAPTLTLRIHMLIERAAAIIALPGNLGTFAELAVAWNAAYVAPASGRSPMPVIAVGPRWRDAVTWLAAGIEAPAELVRCVDSVDAAVTAAVAGLE